MPSKKTYYAHMKKLRAGSAPAGWVISDGDDYLIRTGAGSNNCTKIYASRKHALQALSSSREFRQAEPGSKFKLWAVPLWLMEFPEVIATKQPPVPEAPKEPEEVVV